MIFVYIIKLIAILIGGVFYFIAAIVYYPFNRQTSIEIFHRYLRLLFKTFKIQVEFEFDEPEIRQKGNSILVVLNQSSFLDAFVCPLIPFSPAKGIINFEFAFYPVIGWLTTLVSFTIIRQWPAQAKRTLNRASGFLKSGGNVLISIEGKRSRTGKVNEYKKGPIVMAINNQSNIVPIIIYGSRACLPYGSLLLKAGTVKLRFLKHISTAGLQYEDRDNLREQLIQVAKNEGLT